jgi:hypothetical protein
MRTRKAPIAKKATRGQASWLWEGAGYFLAMAIVGTELITRVTILH